MATRAGLQATIVNDIKRSDLSDEISLAISNAIDYFNVNRFYFLEGIYTFTMSASLKWYDAPSDIQNYDTMMISISGNDYPVEKRSHDHIARLDNGRIFGSPYRFAIFNEQIRAFPPPNQTATATLYYHKGLTCPSGSTSNAWTNGIPRELLRARAKWEIYTIHAIDDDQAARENAKVNTYESQLLTATSKRIGTGRVEKYFF
jgi:hypothetical protein